MDDLKQSRNKELTMQRFIEAVGEIMREEGIKGLGLNNIARRAGYDKNLINRYFGSRDGLLDAYIAEKDYWLKFQKEILRSITEEDDIKKYPAIVANIFKNQLRYFYQDKDAQLIILAELNGQELELLQSIARTRELIGEDVLVKIVPIFQAVGINIRPIMALFTAGIYYVVLHAVNNRSTFAGVDINTEEERESAAKEIDWAIDQIFKGTGLM
jgi:AcrR family transcriptional regulator